MRNSWKRAFDLFFTLLGLVVLIPLGLAIAVVIRLDSRGPIFYRGLRIGRFGIPFRIFKFRTMMPDAEQFGTTTSKRDPRITRVGAVLRRLKLDELPQLINVVLGDMSLVGPRPEVEEHTLAYDEEEQEILSVRPGITDYSSVHFINLGDELGEHGAHEHFLSNVRPQKNAMRLRYVREHSFGGDLVILARTFVALVGQWRPRLWRS